MSDLDQITNKHERGEAKNDVLSFGHPTESSGAEHLRQEWMHLTPAANGKLDVLQHNDKAAALGANATPGDSGSPLAQKVLEVAQKSVGESLWKGTLPDELGKLGAAVSVSKVLQEGGVTGLDTHRSVVGLTSALVNEKHWTKDSDVTQARPGDLLITQEGAHGWIAMVGDHSFYTNKSSTGKWAEVNQLGQHQGETFLLHPPKHAEK